MKTHFLLLTALIAVTVSCNQTENTDCPSQRTAVEFTSNIVSIDDGTRVSGNTWGEGDAIGIYMLESESVTIIEGMGNIEYVTKDGTKHFSPNDETIYFPDNGTEVRFMSYYPYKEQTANFIYKVDVSNQTIQTKIDLLYGFTDDTYNKVNKTVPLEFNHQLTKIIINVKEGEGLKAEDLENITVHLSGLSTKANFDLTEGTLGDLSDIRIITPLTIEAEEDFIASYEAIIIPIESPENKQIVFKLNNGDGEEGDKFTWNFKESLAAKTKYVFNVEVSRSGIVVEATINDWIDGVISNIEAK